MIRLFWFHGRERQRHRYLFVSLITPLLFFLVSHDPGYTQAPPITPSGLNTQVTSAGTGQFNITGGTRAGSNLFHSFGEFNVPTNNIANFLNETAIPTNNILGRVTGGNVSSIFGTIQTEGFGNANLFLMNPGGFLFGPNATVTVGGMVTFTSADYLRLGESGRFNASLNPVVPDLLTSAPVAAFGFLGSNPGALTIHGSQFTVAEGTGISLVGGNISIQSGLLDDGITPQPAHLSAPGGQINLASAASAGEIAAATIIPQPGMTMGSITLSQGSLLDVSADAAGGVRIRGGQLVIDHATVSADTGNVDGAPVAIDINVADSLSLSHDSLPALTARTSGTGNAGDILLSSGSLNATFTTAGTGLGTASLIDSHTTGTGHGGNINISTGPLFFQGDPSAPGYFIDSGSGGEGNGGNVSILAGDAQIRIGGINTGDNTYFGIGSGGNLSIKADSLEIETVSFATDSLNARAGALNLESSGLLEIGGNSFISNISLEGENPTSIKADQFILKDTSTFLSGTAFGEGGDFSITARIIEFSNGGTIATQTFGDGKAGSIQVDASERVSFLNTPDDFRPSGLFTQSLGLPEDGNPFGATGAAGNIAIITPRMELTNGARINSTTLTSGHGGEVVVNTHDLSITGERSFDIPEEQFAMGGTRASGIYTSTLGTDGCTGPCGNAGNISISTNSLTLQSGGLIDSGSTNNGQGGNITVSATNQVVLSGTMLDGTPGGIFSRTIGADPDAGSGGNITLNAGQSVSISDGAQVSANTTGPGSAGNITIQGLASPAQSVLIDGADSGVFTNTDGAGAGGNVFVNANSVTLQNGGTITASTAGPGNAGAIHVEAPQAITLTDRAIISGASENLLSDAQGNGGVITLHAPQISISGGALVSSSTTGPGNAGDVVLEVQTLTLSGGGGQGGRVITNTQGPGQGGSITVRGLNGTESAAEMVQLANGSRLLAQTVGGLTGEEGNAGSILVRTASLQLDGASQLSTAAQDSAGGAGTVTVEAMDAIQLNGSSTITSNSAGASFGPAGNVALTAPTIALTGASVISTGTEFVGNAGNVTINTQTLSLTEGSQVRSNSGPLLLPEFPSGAAGSITVQDLASPVQSVFIDGSGSGLFTATQGSGAGGDISVSAQAVTLQNGSAISSSSTGSGPAGNINLAAGNQLTMTNSSIITEASQSSGGIIKITTNPSGAVELSNSKISASVLDGTGGGGSVDIDPQFVILQNSQILAEAVQGPGGNINITITNGGLFLPDSTSRVSASSQFGQQGTVTIQSPNAPAGGKIQPLGKAPLQVTALLSQRCAAIARGEVSSFVVAGRDTLPTEPGGWLPSPLASGVSEAGSAIEAGMPVTKLLPDSPALVSLRRLPSASKVAQFVADDFFADCRS